MNGHEAERKKSGAHGSIGIMQEKKITKDGSTYYIAGEGSIRTSQEQIFHDLQRGHPMVIQDKKTGRDITQSELSRISRKQWSEEELSKLVESFGRVPLDELHAKTLPNKSPSQIRWKASQLELTSKDIWSETEEKALRLLRAANIRYEEISEILNRSVRSCQVKASLLGFGNAHSQKENLDHLDAELQRFRAVSSIQKGKIAEDLTAIALTMEGFDVFLPYQPNHLTDLLVIKGHKVARIQVKAAIWEKGTGRFRVPLRRKSPRTHDRVNYSKSDVDFFALYCFGVEELYLVPYDACSKVNEAHLYPHRPPRDFSGTDWERYRGDFSSLSTFLD